MGREKVAIQGAARDALKVFGDQIKTARVERDWTQKHLGGVAGVSERTVSLIERGDPAPAIGNVFNAAAAVGVPFFQVTDPEELARMRHRGEEKIALIPKRVVGRSVGLAELNKASFTTSGVDESTSGKGFELTKLT